MDNEKLNNVRRIAYALYCATGDRATMQQLARILHYDAGQLMQDIIDINDYITEKVQLDRVDYDENGGDSLNDILIF